MGCTNHPNEQEIEEMERVANQQSNEVAQEAIGDRSLHQFAEKCAAEVREFANKLIGEAQRSSTPLTRSEIANIESKIRNFANEKAEEVREASNRWKDSAPSNRNDEGAFVSRSGMRHVDRVPDFNDNPDRDTIPGFHMGYYFNSPNNFGMIMKDDNEPGRSTHVHHTKDGIILSSFNANTGTIDRFNLTTGEDWTNEGEETQWPL